jgi:hypothetical protein
MSALYKIVSQSSGKVLDVPAFSTSDGTKIQQFTENGGTNQHWRLISVGSGLFEIVSQSSGKVLDVPAASTTNGTVIQQFTEHGGTNQQWQIVLVSL